MELFDNVKKIFTRSAFIALAALMVACGRNTDDVMENLEGAIIGLENGDTTNVENATNTAEKYIDKIIEKAEKEGNTEERYKAEYMRMLNYAIQNLSEAQKGLIGLKSAESTGVLAMIKEARDKIKDSDQENNIKKESAYDLSIGVVEDFIKAVANYNITGELIEIAGTGNISDIDYTTALNGVESAQHIISDQLFDENNGYFIKIKTTFGLSDAEIMELLKLHAEPGYNSDEFIKEVQELANAIVDRAFNPEKDNGESENDKDKDKDTKSSNDSKVSEDSKGSDDSIIQRRLKEFKIKGEKAWKTFESKFNGRIAELGTQVEQNVNALGEKIQEGAEERAQEGEKLGWNLLDEYFADDNQEQHDRANQQLEEIEAAEAAKAAEAEKAAEAGKQER